jgi:hypothetical protein
MAAPIHGFIIAEDEAMAGWIGFDLGFVGLGSDYQVKIRGAEVGWNAVVLLGSAVRVYMARKLPSRGLTRCGGAWLA